MRKNPITETELLAVAEGKAPPDLTELVERAAVENRELGRSLAAMRHAAAAMAEERCETRAAADRIARRVRMKLQYGQPVAAASRRAGSSGFFAFFRPVTAGVAIALVALAVAGLLYLPAESGTGSHDARAERQVAYQPAAQSPVEGIDALISDIREAQSGAVVRVASGKISDHIRIEKPIRLERAAQ